MKIEEKIDNALGNAQYTVQRVRRDDTLYGPVHGSKNANETLCGKNIDEDWWIVTTNFDGTVTCKECIRKMK